MAVIWLRPTRMPPSGCSAQVRYQAEVTLDEYVPTRRDNIGDLVINAFILIGILLAFSIVSGLAFGGLRAFRRRGKTGDEPDADDHPAPGRIAEPISISCRFCLP